MPTLPAQALVPAEQAQRLAAPQTEARRTPASITASGRYAKARITQQPSLQKHVLLRDG